SLLFTHPDPQRRNPQEAVSLAARAVQMEPDIPGHWKVLGAARYYANDFPGAIEALEKSSALQKSHDGIQTFFLAMSHLRLCRKDEARKWYDRAVRWSGEKKCEGWLRFIRAEAAALLGVSEKPNPKPPAKAADGVKAPAENPARPDGSERRR